MPLFWMQIISNHHSHTHRSGGTWPHLPGVWDRKSGKMSQRSVPVTWVTRLGTFSGSGWIMGSAGQLWPVGQKKTSWFLNCNEDGSSHDLPRSLAAQFLSKTNEAKQKIAAGCFTFVAHHSNFLAIKRILSIAACSTPQVHGVGCATNPATTIGYAYPPRSCCCKGQM